MFKKVVLTIIVLAAVVTALVTTKLDQFQTMGEAAQNMVIPPETVTAMTVVPQSWEQVIRATGTISAVQGVTIGAEVGGRISEIAFESGQAVEKGAVLLRLDTASEEAQLASAQAAADLAKTDLERARKLAKRKLTSEDAIDRAEAEVKQTVAQIGVIRALIAKKTIRAPFAGRLGLRLVDPGQILREGDPIVTLQTLDPVHVDFSVPQQQLLNLQPDMRIRVSVDVMPEKAFEGRVIAINPEVDRVTRNVRVRALVGNPDERLRAGMFATVEVILPDKQHVLPIASSAVLYAPFGDSVFVIDTRKNDQTGEEEHVLRQQFIRLGRARGDFVDVLEGLEEGDQVVTSGAFKLRSDMRVIIDNTLAPQAELEPTPGDS